MVKKYPLYFLNFLLILIAIILYLATFLNHELMKNIFSYSGYYFILLLIFIWLITLLECLHQYKTNLRLFFKSYAIGLIACLILSVVIFVSVKSDFRILSDETNILANSKSMLYERRPDNVTMGNYYYDMFFPIKRNLPKRPLLFPFFAQILHLLTGYRPENVYALNFIVLFSLFSLIYILVKRRLGSVWAFSAVLLVAGQPVISQAATSGGFDLMSSLFLVVCFASLQWFLKERSAISFQLLWLNLLMLSNVRYEGIMFFAIVIAFLVLLKYINIDIFKKGMTPVYFCTPAILLPVFWQRFLMFLKPDQFETAGEVAAFSVGNFIKNSTIFFKTFFDYNFYLPYATIVNFLGLLSLFYFGTLLLSGRLIKAGYQKHLIIISFICILANWFLYIPYHAAIMDHPADSRFFIIFCIMFSMLAIFLLNRFNFFSRRPGRALVFSVLIFVLYHPVSVQDRFSRSMTLPRQYRFVINFLKEASTHNHNFLVIAEMPGQYTVHNYGTVDFKYANKSNSVKDMYNNHVYNDIFVVQEISYETLAPIEGTMLDDNYALEKIIELMNKEGSFTRISKVVSVAENKKVE